MMKVKILGFFITLLAHCFNCSTVLALEIYRPDNLLASKEKVSTGFVIRQDTCRAGAIFVSRPNPTDVSILDLLHTYGISSAEDYARWLQETIEYKKDEGGDNWAEAQETLEKKRGDCEDFAFLNAAVVSVLGYGPKVLGLNGIRSQEGKLIGNHAICVFEQDGRILYFDNQKLKNSPAASIEEFARYMFKHYHCFSISELKLDNNHQQEKQLAFKYAQPF